MKVTSSESWVTLAQGRLFSKQWAPGAGVSSAAPILLMHDSLGCVGLWRDFPEALSASTGRRVVAYDRLGFGRSDSRSSELSLSFDVEEATQYVPAVLRHYEIDRFVALGHSIGGGMAVHLAAQSPMQCEALVTVAAQAFVEERTLAGIRLAKALFEDPLQMEKLAKYHGSKAKWVVDAWVNTWLAPAFRDWTLAGVLPRVRCPVYALHGELDEYGSQKHPQRIADLVSGVAKMEILPGGGHVPHREQRLLLIEKVTAFLASLAI